MIFTRRLETYKRMSVFYNVQDLKNFRPSLLCGYLYWFSFKFNYTDVMLLCESWSCALLLVTKSHHVDQFQKGQCVMAKAYLVDVLSWEKERSSGKIIKAEVCGRGCVSGSWVKALTRPNCQVKKQETERWTHLNYWFFHLKNVSTLWIDFIL